MSIRDNLSLVDSNLKNQIAAMKRVGVYNEIEKLPYGINTIIDESNMMLTDGQLKKLAIARALLTKAEILLFDEVTSSVDPATTNDILRILKDLREDHTILIVTHKAEIMELSDQVIVLDRGRVAAKGRNTEVFEKSALYRELRTHTVSEPSVNAVFSEKPTDDDGGYINECEDSDIQEAKEARLS
jgi:ABC-type transport system involved in cytochrome bd biosynthesis fused ATPase/permease subunit